MDKLYEKLSALCHSRLDGSEEQAKRLEEELKDIQSQNEAEYFLNLIGKKYDNENNLIVPYLLGICDDFDINRPPSHTWGDFPDVDIDYVPPVRNYLKENYSQQQFGSEYVCNIATYTTFGLRNSLIDMAKVFDLDRREILNLTTRLGIKDDEGEVLAWDKAVELYDDLREYLERNPEMAEATKKILHRNRNLGMHASGLIISGMPINNFIPLVKVKDTSQPCSSWVEGLHGSDLGAVGLVKFDFLSLEANMKIATACRLVQEYYGCKVAALPGKSNWTDLTYLDDPLSMEMANKGDLKMVFQYDGSEGIRRLAKQGGVSSFDDLAAYTALFRPSCLKHGLHEIYCNRKRGKEKYEIHPKLEFMRPTYGVLVYQEDTMRILNVVGKIPLKDCEAVRKAISKKKVEKFKEYKDTFVKNGQEVLQQSKEEVERLWDNIEAFAGYGFNKAHCIAYSYISARMLYLKANYPLAFYASVLSHTNPAGPKDYLKLKDYKCETERHGINVKPLDINKSGKDCKIVCGDIYYGFSKIKGVGEEVAARMEKRQPYQDYPDFLNKFGLDAKANQAVIALRLFTDRDPETLYKFYLRYKEASKKEKEKLKKHENKLKECKDTLLRITGKEEPPPEALYFLNQESFNAVVTAMKQMDKLNYQKENLPTLDNFVDIEIEDKEYLSLLQSEEKAQQFYYGFLWKSKVEKCEKYSDKTIDNFRTSQWKIGPIEVEIKSVDETKGPKTTFYKVKVEDAVGENAMILVWKRDYERLKDRIQKGLCVRMQVKAPDEGFTAFSIAPLFNQEDNRVFVIG